MSKLYKNLMKAQPSILVRTAISVITDEDGRLICRLSTEGDCSKEELVSMIIEELYGEFRATLLLMRNALVRKNYDEARFYLAKLERDLLEGARNVG